MLKANEAAMAGSCWNKARLDERVFVLLARDKAAPDAIRFWVAKRVELGLNGPEDDQIQEALRCALLMERDRESPERKGEEG